MYRGFVNKCKFFTGHEDYIKNYTYSSQKSKALKYIKIESERR